MIPAVEAGAAVKMRIFVFWGCPVHAGGPEAEALHVKVYDTQ